MNLLKKIGVFCLSLLLSLSLTQVTVLANDRGQITLGEKISYQVSKGDTDTYSITVPSGNGSGILEISGTFESRKNQDITIYDDQDKSVATDAGFWRSSKNQDKLSLSISVDPGLYTMKIYNKSSDIISGSLTCTFTADDSTSDDTNASSHIAEVTITDTASKTSDNGLILTSTLKKNQSGTSTITLNKKGTLLITGTASSQHDQSIYIIDSDKTVLDQDHSADWTKKNNTASLSFRTINLKKGTYTIKITNQKDSSLTYYFNVTNENTLPVGKVSIKKITNQKSKKAKVTFKAVKNAAYYQVAYRIKGKGSYKVISTTKTSYTLKNLKKKTYQVKVRAINGYVNGAYSKVKTIKIKK